MDQHDMNTLRYDHEHGMDIGSHPVLDAIYGQKEEFPDIFDMDKSRNAILKRHADESRNNTNKVKIEDMECFYILNGKEITKEQAIEHYNSGAEEGQKPLRRGKKVG